MCTKALNILILTWLFVAAGGIGVPEVQGRERLELAGQWHTNLGECRLPGTTDESHLGGGQHPTDVDYQLTRLWPYAGVVVYEREIIVPQKMADQPLQLWMERTKPSCLWVDGDSIGRRDHLYAPHVYRIAGLAEGRHTLRIAVDNGPQSVPAEIQGSHAWTDATQTNWNGILGEFYLETLPSLRLDDVQVYPDVDKNSIQVRYKVGSESRQPARFVLNVYKEDDVQAKEGNMVKAENKASAGDKAELASRGNAGEKAPVAKRVVVTAEVPEGESTYTAEVTFDMKPELWSEFHPALYRLQLTSTAEGTGMCDTATVTFGMRKLEVEGRRMKLNGHYIFLRGKHDACVFPLTGYAPMDVESWEKVLRKAKAYGINHYRFHSWAPPKAAFEAADRVGIYMAPELPLWGTIDPSRTALNEFLRREGSMLLNWCGNAPSFCMMGLGNELWGDVEEMHRWLDAFRAEDGRHLYNYGSNNQLGWQGPHDGEDYYTTCRVGGKVDQSGADPHTVPEARYSSHVRSSFSYADADGGGILNMMRPNTRRDYRQAILACPRPVVSHETCQFQIWPDFDQIDKYTGVLYPYNLEVFRDRLERAGLARYDKAFAQASGLWSVACDKADIEYCLRTSEMGGYQMLDLQDYPGQGSALCGPLDAMMESKGIVTAEQFREFCSPVVPLALMDSLCISTAQGTLTLDVSVFNYSESDWTEPVCWTLTGKDCRLKGKISPVCVGQGDVAHVGSVPVSLGKIKKAQRLTLTLTTGAYCNTYSLWVYPEPAQPESAYVSGMGSVSEQAHKTETTIKHPKARKSETAFIETDTLDAVMASRLEEGATVLLTPKAAKNTVGPLFTNDYWNYAMFKTISENNRKTVSPGTLGYLIESGHGALASFPTDTHTDWQWWCIAQHTRPLILDGVPTELHPIVRAIDNVNRCHSLGVLMELRVGRGRLMLCMCDLKAISPWTEGRAFARSIRQYMTSRAFDPTDTLTVAQLRALLDGERHEENIQGVENISDYAQP